LISGARLTSSLKRRLHPIWRELGFDELSNRGARGRVGPTTILTVVERIGNQSHRGLDIDPGSLTAYLAIDYGHATGASFLGYYSEEQRRLHIEQTDLRCRLVRTSGAPASDITALVWPIRTAEDLDVAVDDLADAYDTQGRRFLAEWTNLPNAFERLKHEEITEQPEEVDSPLCTLPGRPGSVSRMYQLAVLADLLGRRDDERRILEEYRTQELIRAAGWRGLSVEELAEHEPDTYARIPSPAVVARLSQLS
jgi:hypothetical protein